MAASVRSRRQVSWLPGDRSGVRFLCKHCGYPGNVEAGVALSEAVCAKCHHALNLTLDERTIGKYELLEKIGSGGYGTVWKARSPDSDCCFALKLIPKSSVSEDERIHLLRQLRSSQHLSHPSVVATRDFGEVKDSWFLVSDYVDGTPLGEWAKRVQPDPEQAALLCAALADAIHYVHRQGFVHRDLKPGNVIMDRDDRPHLIDFGLSKCERDSDLMAIERYRAAHQLIRQDREGGAPSILGTPAYASPEQVRGDGLNASAQSDIYSLGVIFYELLCGCRPFTGRGQALVRQILSGRPRRPSRYRNHIPAELDAICLKAISKQVGERYRTAADFAADCRNAVAGKPIEATLSRWRFWQ